MKTALYDYTSAADAGVLEVSRFMVSDTNWKELWRQEQAAIIDIGLASTKQRRLWKRISLAGPSYDYTS